MTAVSDTSLSHGTNGSPQSSIEEEKYSTAQEEIEKEIGAASAPPPKYAPSPKHEAGHNWGSANPIKTLEEGQRLLDEGYYEGRQAYNISDSGQVVKFQPDGTMQNGYHAYEVSKPQDIPPSVLKQLFSDGKISRSEYNKLRKGKR